MCKLSDCNRAVPNPYWEATVNQLHTKLHAWYGPWRVTIVITTQRHWTQFRRKRIQCNSCLFKIQFNVILLSMSRSPKGPLNFSMSNRNSVRISHLSQAYLMSHPTTFPGFWLPEHNLLKGINHEAPGSAPFSVSGLNILYTFNPRFPPDW
jgi:hypothetical protein